MCKVEGSAVPRWYGTPRNAGRCTSLVPRPGNGAKRCIFYPYARAVTLPGFMCIIIDEELCLRHSMNTGTFCP